MPRVLIYDDLNPEDTAMLQALYSRSAASVTTHLDKVRASGSGKFMERYYIGYGHRSIGDCGSSTIFIEGISELAAKAIQDWPLYSGQQTSTRYIDFANQPLLDPLGTATSRAILRRWMTFYSEQLEAVREHIAGQHPWNPDEGEKPAWERAIQSRTFDVLRAFLPAGVTTQLSWHTNLRQALDKLELLTWHPLPEVRQLALEIRAQLESAYPHSFEDRHYQAKDEWRSAMVAASTYLDLDWPAPIAIRQANTLSPSLADTQIAENARYQSCDSDGRPIFQSLAQFDPDELAGWGALLSRRPQKTDLPHALDAAGQIRARFLLDYGSFRDLQRHRHGVIRMPLLTTRHGFEPWYLTMLPPKVREEAKTLLAEQAHALAGLDLAPELAQYYLAFGYRVVCDCSWGLPSAVYIAELRSGQTVHPTLRRIAQALGSALEAVPQLALYIDRSPDLFSLKRGQQDIIERDPKPPQDG